PAAPRAARPRRWRPGSCRSRRPATAQWLKNGLVFAGLVFGGRLFEPGAFASAVLAAIWFSLLSSGFYLVNDVRDRHVDRLHPEKRNRPVAAGLLAPGSVVILGTLLIAIAVAGSALSGFAFFLVASSYAVLMAAYNLGLKQIVILDVFAIATGFVLRAAGGAIAVNVSISPWLLVCTMLLALLLGFGKRRHELVTLDLAAQHRANLETYTERVLDQAVAVSATGALLAYAIYTLDSESVAYDHRMMVTIPIVAYGIFRYLYLVYGRGQGGAPETMLLTDRSLLGAVVLWSAVSIALFYLTG
ncbi:MAG TPA: decaprenyl-phosphate phosphoribosyltransferase, partial [Thermomicrobiales bacterium]|nr:decaprenyl-phosphate phosphoribosyltransferase [Thermomicrobiales bacterium]